MKSTYEALKNIVKYHSDGYDKARFMGAMEVLTDPEMHRTLSDAERLSLIRAEFLACKAADERYRELQDKEASHENR